MRFGPAFTHLLQVPVSTPNTLASRSQEQHPLSRNHFAAESHPDSESFDRFVNHTLEHFHVPGLAMAIVDGDKTIFKVCKTTFHSKSPYLIETELRPKRS